MEKLKKIITQKIEKKQNELEKCHKKERELLLLQQLVNVNIKMYK